MRTGQSHERFVPVSLLTNDAPDMHLCTVIPFVLRSWYAACSEFQRLFADLSSNERWKFLFTICRPTFDTITPTFMRLPCPHGRPHGQSDCQGDADT